MEEKSKEIELKRLEEQRQAIRNKILKLDEEKNLLLTRLIELQGIINYLNTPPSEPEKEEEKK